ncbi:MAG: REP-associated tyrosine transposase [Bacteroidota bacterium]
MKRYKYQIYDEEYPYFLTCSLHRRESLFSDPELAEIILQSLEFQQAERGLKLYAYVIMHNHLHLIAQSTDLASKLRKLKSYTARRMVDSLRVRNRSYLLRNLRLPANRGDGTAYRIWQKGFHPKQIGSHEIMLQKLAYIHDNPVKAGFVAKAEHWRYSSAGNYQGQSGLIPITLYQR